MKFLFLICSVFVFIGCLDLKQDPISLPLEPTPTLSSEQVLSSISPDDIISAQELLLKSIYQKALPSIVQVKIETVVSQRSFFGGLRRYNIPIEGTGFIWNENGYIVTNHHVIQNADTVRVIFDNETEFVAKIHGTDPHSDLAVLKINPGNTSLTAISLADSDKLSIGQMAVVIGSPFGQEFSMTQGIISGLGRTLPSQTNFATSEIIQTDAAINPGNSGGPLLDKTGSVIGIASQIVSNTGSNTGVGFAIPINTAKRIIPSLIEKKTFKYAYLGITAFTLTSNLSKANGVPEKTQGALIVSVFNNGPAFKANLRISEKTKEINGIEYPIGGDIITHIDQIPIKSINDIIEYISNKQPNDIVSLSIIRSGKTKLNIELKLGERP